MNANPFTHMAGSLGARPVPNLTLEDSQAKPLNTTAIAAKDLKND